MASQEDPQGEFRGTYVRRVDGSWNVLPLLLGALAIVVVGYMFLGDRFSPDRSPNTGIERPNTNVPKSN